jgi:hypothetical protein
MRVLACLLLSVAPLMLGGCYTVKLNPIPVVEASPLPISAAVEISEETSALTYDVNSFAAGAANRWRILVGEALVQYAEAYLRPVFPQGDDVSISVSIQSFDVHDFEAHIDAQFTVSREGEILFEKRYHTYGKGYFAQTVWGGAFAMKSSMRKTTDEALRSLFERFLSDVGASYTGWVTEEIEVPVEPVGS